MQSINHLQCMAWAGNYNDNFLQSKCAWVNKQHELIIAVNNRALKRIKHDAEGSVSWVGGKAIDIPPGNLVLLCDHLEGCNKIQGNYKSKLFLMELKQKDPNVYTIKPLNGKGPMHMVNQQQLFYLHKSQGNTMPSNQAPYTNLTITLNKKTMGKVTLHNSHPYGTRFKARAHSIVLDSSSKDE